MRNSIYLIRKDFFLVRKFLLLLIPYYIIIGFTNVDAYSVFALLPAMLILLNACAMDVLDNNQRFQISLPVPRHQLVLAKYLSLIPYAIISLICTLLLYLSGVLSGQISEPVAWRELLLTIATFPVLAAFYLPLYFWLGQKGMQIVNFAFIMLIMLNITATSHLAKRFPALLDWIHPQTSSHILLWAIGGVAYIFLLYCSYLISLRIFVKKDI
ncbi:hypothetical protein A3844_29590 [Paenibacillus helianthi]|uniref:ABC-2 transporter permease n=1 Tax=Paenibacillus helianthi TaxID=1349432 RepID=A0ABX3EEE6_9BACL|nr:ABC-2 transporter permease [Paenibacillus helianthi]OKP77578.1 hypothetical protein A3844_29590 [Paenibacillus helianthi]